VIDVQILRHTLLVVFVVISSEDYSRDVQLHIRSLCLLGYRRLNHMYGNNYLKELNDIQT
jgi:hypothetical protein